MNRHCCLMLLSLPLLAACGKPQPPETERRPEPQAAMREAIAQPLEQAKATEDAAKAEQAALDTAAGNAAAPK